MVPSAGRPPRPGRPGADDLRRKDREPRDAPHRRSGPVRDNGLRPRIEKNRAECSPLCRRGARNPKHPRRHRNELPRSHPAVDRTRIAALGPQLPPRHHAVLQPSGRPDLVIHRVRHATGLPPSCDSTGRAALRRSQKHPEVLVLVVQFVCVPHNWTTRTKRVWVRRAATPGSGWGRESRAGNRDRRATAGRSGTSSRPR